MKYSKIYILDADQVAEIKSLMLNIRHAAYLMEGYALKRRDSDVRRKRESIYRDALRVRKILKIK